MLLYLTRGDTRAFDFNTSVAITGRVVFTLKYDLADLDSDAIVQLSTDLDDGIEIDPEDDKHAIVTIPASATDAIAKPVRLFWDVQQMTVDDEPCTAVTGELELSLDATRTVP